MLMLHVRFETILYFRMIAVNVQHGKALSHAITKSSITHTRVTCHARKIPFKKIPPNQFTYRKLTIQSNSQSIVICYRCHFSPVLQSSCGRAFPCAIWPTIHVCNVSCELSKLRRMSIPFNRTPHSRGVWDLRSRTQRKKDGRNTKIKATKLIRNTRIHIQKKEEKTQPKSTRNQRVQKWINIHLIHNAHLLERVCGPNDSSILFCISTMQPLVSGKSKWDYEMSARQAPLLCVSHTPSTRKIFIVQELRSKEAK